jgi:toxin ParE1/3/4
MKVIFRAKARAELLDIIAWYENQRTGLGADFRAAVKALLQRATENVGRFRKLSPVVRVGRLTKFPYFVYFSKIADRIEVLAIIYTKRDPQWIDKRLRD